MSSLEPKHPAVRLAVRIAVVVLVVGSLAGAIVAESGRIASIDWRFSPGWLGLCLLSLLAFQLLHIEIWRLMLRSLGGQIEPRRARAIWSATLLARYVPTSMLMAVGRVALSEREGVSKRVTLASVVYEFALTFITALALAVYLVLKLDWFDAHQFVRYLAIALPVAGLVCLHPAIFHRVADFIFKRMGRDPLPLSLGFGRVLEFAAMYIVSFIVAGCSVLAMAHALHPLGAGDSAAAIASYGLGYVAGVLAFVIPGSLGAREAGVALGLSAVLPGAVAVAVAIAVRLLQMGVEVLYAVVTPLIARRGRARSAAGTRPASA
ncbi:MAG: glycosyltransferase 2 family protein [Thermoleophilaceae bacterium]|nr:glycosyltransferase 2 family protein [Thermoleophilaceae bacterium]